MNVTTANRRLIELFFKRSLKFLVFAKKSELVLRGIRSTTHTKLVYIYGTSRDLACVESPEDSLLSLDLYQNS